MGASSAAPPSSWSRRRAAADPTIRSSLFRRRKPANKSAKHLFSLSSTEDPTPAYNHNIIMATTSIDLLTALALRRTKWSPQAEDLPGQIQWQQLDGSDTPNTRRTVGGAVVSSGAGNGGGGAPSRNFLNVRLINYLSSPKHTN